MSELKCPFCQQELEKDDLDVQLFGCENQNCKYSTHYDAVGTKELWQELIRTRKALDVAVKGLKHIRGTCLSYAADYMDAANNILKQITALEQKDK